MLRTHRQAKRDDGDNRLRQLWLVWLALVLVMFAANPAPRPHTPPLAIFCTDNAQTRSGDHRRRAQPYMETIQTSAFAHCARRKARRNVLPRLGAFIGASVPMRMQKNLEKEFARQMLPGARRLRARSHRPARAAHAFAPG